MTKRILLVLLFAYCSTDQSQAGAFVGPDTVSVQSEGLTLKGLLWRPTGSGPFPSVIFCHGSYSVSDTIPNPEQELSSLGPVFASKGYTFFVLFRRGVGLSRGKGESSADLMSNALTEKGIEERNKVQLHQLETNDLQEMISGLTFLKSRQDIDSNRIAAMGHSFGGSLALLLAEHEPSLKSVVVFGAAAKSWDLSPRLRIRLTDAVKNISAPIMIIHAENDYSTKPGYALDSVMNSLDKRHVLKIYPKLGHSTNEGHNLIFLSIQTWEADVLRFLAESLGH
jgi:carboxymethylenebutenolidase